jgi:hypothetical protein
MPGLVPGMLFCARAGILRIVVSADLRGAARKRLKMSYRLWQA